MAKIRPTPRRTGAATATVTAFSAATPSPDHFTRGAKVEVSSEDEGFRGAWYEAVVIRRRIGDHRHPILVEYTSLLSDDDPSSRLRESISPSHVRPCPPRTRGRGLSLHDHVEGYHNDGWWPGVVAAVLGHRHRYAVCFPGTKEVVELRRSEVRPRLQWVRGQWLPPDDQCEPMYSVGELVEVTRDKDNFGAAWFPATIKKIIGKTFFLVEYDQQASSKSIEIVDAQYVRPLPPNSEEPKDLNLLDKVEAFCKDRWSTGVVSRIYLGSKYVIKFQYPEVEGDELVFHRSQLRPQRDWVDGHWVDASNQVESSKSDIADKTKSIGRKRKLEVGKRASLPLSVSDMSDSEDKVEHEDDSNASISSLKKCKHSFKVRLLPKKLNKGESVVDLDATSPEAENGSFLIDKQSYCKERYSASSILASTLTPVSYSGELAYEDYIHKLDEMTKKLSKDRKPSKSEDEVSKLQSKNPDPNHPLFGDGTNNIFLANAWGNGKCVRTTVNGLPRRKKLVARRPSNSHRKSSEATDKKIRGRPRKLSIVHRISSSEETGLRQMQLSCLIDEEENGRKNPEQSLPNLSDLIQHEVQPVCHENQVTMYKALPVFQLNEVMSPDGSPEHVDPAGDPPESTLVNIKMVDRELKGLQACNASDKALVKRQLEFCNGEEASVSYSANENISAAGDADYQVPLSSLTKDSVIIHEEPSPTDASAKKFLVETERTAADLSSNCSSMKKITLPFAKDSPVWGSLELMEVFHAMPQHPHFRPLEQYCEAFREGMAIGLMATFASLVANIRKLRITDPNSLFEEKLKALLPLEANGFDVEPARSRIKVLLEMKSNQTQSMSRKCELQRHITDCSNEKDRTDALAVAIDKAVMELQESLACFQERKASVDVQRKSSESEIFRMQMDLQAAEEASLFVEDRFNSALAAPW